VRARDFGSDDDDDDDDDVGGPVGWFIPDGGFGTDPNAPNHPTVEAARLGGVERSDWAKDDDETRGGLRGRSFVEGCRRDCAIGSE